MALNGFAPTPPEQIESLRDYDEFHRAMNHKLITRANEIVDVLQTFFLRIKKTPKEITKEDLKKYFAEFKYDNAYQDKFHKGGVKKYFKWLYGIEEWGKYPELVEWIKLPKTELPPIEKKECLSYEDIKKMISKSKTIRDKCLIAMLYEGGFRAGEILNIRIKDVEINPRDAVVRIETGKVKNGGSKRFREVLLVDSYYYLQMWIRDHPQKDNPEAFLFYNYNFKTENKQLGYTGLYFIVTDLAKKAGIKKKFNPHNFRHSAVKNSEGDLSDSEQRVRYGWERGSPMIARYSGLSSEDVIEKQRLQKGLIEPNQEKKSNKPIFKECPRCQQSNNLNVTQYCSRCGSPLSVKATMEIDKTMNIAMDNQAIKELIKKQLVEEYKKEIIAELKDELGLKK